MALKLGRQPVPSSAAVLKAEAERFLATKGFAAATVWRVEPAGPSVHWLLFSTAVHKARYAVVGGETPNCWELIAEGSGWPVL